MTESTQFMEHDAILDLIGGVATVLRNRLRDRRLDNPAMIGIHTGGAWVAEHLNTILELDQPSGLLDISFYRDDFTQIGVNPQVRPSKIDFDVDGRNVVLVDDVLHTGRTIRAAMNEIFDYGRPASITLVALIERSGRELPIQPDVIGLSPPLDLSDHIKLNGPDPLSLEIFHGPRAGR
jgi:pyrimidine operon attenuation protein/uracil phosphoribosyltransferase